MKKRTFAFAISGIVLIIVAIIVTAVVLFVIPFGDQSGTAFVPTNDNTMNVANGSGVIDIGGNDYDGADSMNASIDSDASSDAESENVDVDSSKSDDDKANNDSNVNGEDGDRDVGSSMTVTDITKEDERTVIDALSSVTAITGNISSYDVDALKDAADHYFADVDDIPSGYRTFTNYAYRIMSNLDTPENIAFNGEHRKFVSADNMSAATVSTDGSVYTVDVTYDITYTPLSDEEKVRTERMTINEMIRINSNGKIYSIEDNL